MNRKELESLNEILNYLYADEEKNWEGEGRPSSHIFNDVQTLHLYWRKMNNEQDPMIRATKI